ncbi:MAG: M3 family metallopeptidase [Bacteroidota bacterium]
MNQIFLNSQNAEIDFNSLTHVKVEEATGEIINDSNKRLQKIISVSKKDRNRENTLEAFDDLHNELEQVHSLIFLMAYVHPEKTIRDKCLQSINELNRYANQLNMNVELYSALKEYADTEDAKEQDEASKKLLNDTIRDLENNGLGLPEQEREEVRKIQDRISELGVEFESNISSYNDALIVSEDEMEGLPEDYKSARKMEDGNYRIDLSYPSYFPFMKYAKSSEARKELAKKFQNIASDKNLEVLNKMLIERKKLARSLGYKSFAEYQLKNKMAKTPKAVWEFEESLKTKVQQKSEKDYAELLEMKSEYLGDHNVKKIDSWDKGFYSTLLKRKKYEVDDEKVKEFFEVNRVIRGLFDISEKLFNVQFEEEQEPNVWHPEVRKFNVRENDKVIGQFYFDLYPRDDKFNHAAVFSVVPGKAKPEGYQLPVAALVTNFPRATSEKPALLTHSDVVTLFHEFGHLMHDVLTKAPYAEQSGTSVVRDFVEVPSQFFEHLAWEYESLKIFANHYKEHFALPEELYQKMINAKNVGSGIFTLQQIFYAMIDMTFHDYYDPENESRTTTDIVRELQNKITPFEYIEGTHFEAGFGHLFGYAAGYYGYMWAKVYADDFFSVFSEEGVLNPRGGEQFKKKVLEKGSSVEESEIAKNYLGREVDYNAFLRDIGLDPEV